MSVVLKTTQVSALKIITDTLKDLIQDVSIDFIRNPLCKEGEAPPPFLGDQDPSRGSPKGLGAPGSEAPWGGTLLAIDNTKTALIYLFLDPNEINKSGLYSCDISASVGINLPILHKILKTIKDNDTITIRLIPGPQTESILFIDSANIEKKKTGSFQVPLLDMDVDNYVIPDENFDR
jgi:hypothetical protein